jgi:hypothetical protein
MSHASPSEHTDWKRKYHESGNCGNGKAGPTTPGSLWGVRAVGHEMARKWQSRVWFSVFDPCGIYTPRTRGVLDMTRRLLIPLTLVALAAVAMLIAPGARPAAARSMPQDPGTAGVADSSLWIEMRNVNLHTDEEHVLRVRSLRGQVEPTTPGTVPLLDDPATFRIRVTSGTVGLTGPDLAGLLNAYVFAYRGAPIRNIRARTSGPQVVISGIMHKGVDIPFEMTATMTLDTAGRIRAHPTRMRILGVNGTALLHALGLRLDKVLDLSGSRGASVQGDDMLLDPTKIIPPPAITGRLASIAVEGDQIVQTFVATSDDAAGGARFRPDSAARHYIYFRGGRLTFGKLTMTDTDLLIVDADQSDPFDMYMVKYNRQLVAGSTRNLANFGLRVSMPDYARVKGSGGGPIARVGESTSKRVGVAATDRVAKPGDLSLGGGKRTVDRPAVLTENRRPHLR